MSIVSCEQCGISFERSPSRIKRSPRQFCSRQCCADWQSTNRSGENSPRYTKITVKCEQCGKAIQRYPSHAKKVQRHFCNHRCWGDWRSENVVGEKHWSYAKVTLKCAQCGTEFQRDLSHSKYQRHFCNNQCARKWQSANIRGDSHPGYTTVTVKCTRCETEFQRVPSKIKEGARHFCSSKCSELAHTKRQMVSCDQCGKPVEKHAYTLASNKHIFCNSQCLGKWNSENRTGEKNPTWKGGKVYYRGPNWQRQRKRARKRDSYTCQHCSITEKKHGQSLDVHHIIPFREFGYILGENENYKQANKLANLITLCFDCHVLAENGRVSIQLPLLTFSET